MTEPLSPWTRDLSKPHPSSPSKYWTTSGGATTGERSYPYLRESGTLTSRENGTWLWLESARRRGKFDTPAHLDFYNRFKKFDHGSNFTLDRIRRSPVSERVLNMTYPVVGSTTGGTVSYQGPNAIQVGDQGLRDLCVKGLYWPSREELEVAMFSNGGAAISRTLPTRSTANLAVGLAEILREGIPQMVGSIIRRDGINPASLGSEFLNYEFGWAPLIRDIKSVIDAVARSSELLREFHEHSGKHMRRRYEFPVQQGTDVIQGGSALTALYEHRDLCVNRAFPFARPQVERTYNQRTWFSGAYTYYLPYGDDLLSKIRVWEAEANHLMGIRLTPEVVWNLAPWTWLSDWFVNIGDVFRNVSHIGQDGLTLHYAYIMQTTEVVARVTLPGVQAKHGGICGENVTLTRKLRRKASPYGFGPTATALTPKQWAILGAIGATRAPGLL